MITYKIGDMFTSEMNVLGHGVNCKGDMGSGIAVLIKRKFRDCYKVYRKVCKNKQLKGGDMLPTMSSKGTMILNIASQEKTGRNAKYPFLEAGVDKAFVWCEENGVKGFALPRIGSGVGGLEERKVEEILIKIADNHPSIEMELWTLP